MAVTVAEIGCNHKGDMGIAEDLIKTAALFCRADYVKFQKRSNRELLTAEEYSSPHPNPANSYGATYGEHREFLEFNIDQHKKLFDWCEKYGIKYACSAWELTSAKELASLGLDYIKIPSACNLNYEMLAWLADNYKGDIHISFGMTSKAEEKEIVDFFVGKKANERLVIYSCTSGYPVPFEDVCLLEIQRLIESYGNMVKEVGFSGHHLGIAVDIAAVTLGATWVERHYTLDRTWKGTDHSASLEPGGFMKLVRDIKAVEKALAHKEKDLLDIEVPQRAKLKRFASA